MRWGKTRGGMIGLFFLVTALTFGQSPSLRRSLSDKDLAKCSPAVVKRLQRLILDREPFTVMVIVSDEPEISHSFTGQSFIPLSESATGYQLGNFQISTLDDVAGMLECDQVKFVDLAGKKPYSELIIKDYDRGLNRLGLAQQRFPTLRGQDLRVSVKEDLFDRDDIDYRDRVYSFPPEDLLVTTHATTMATVIAGAGHTSSLSLGVAPEVELSAASFLNLLPDGDDYFQLDQISVQNHSYGIDIENFYGIEALAYDDFATRHPTVVHVFSAGNQGAEIATNGKYHTVPGWGTITGNFKLAKNVLTVGAVDSFAMVSTLNSKGPAYDGRVKPELVAMGQRGSSEAAATVSGAAILVQQVYQEKTGELPTADLAKNILINTADDVGPPGIDFMTGYGNLNLYRALQTVSEGRYFSGSLSQRDTLRFQVHVPEQTRQLKVALSWSDIPAQVNAERALVNDLDLKLTSPEGKVWLPWVLSDFPNLDSLSKKAARKEDRLNTVEQISVPDPVSGIYDVMVTGYDLKVDAQSFNISYLIDSAESFLWIGPAPEERVTASQELVLRWDQNFDLLTGRLDYSLDGEHWILIDSLIVLDRDYYRWVTPNIFSTAQLRMQIGGQIFISDPFIISEKPQIQLGYDCDDEVLLNWDSVSGATKYHLYQIVKGQRQVISTVDVPYFVLNKNTSKATYFAVAPVNLSGVEGLRSNAIDLDRQGSFCYVVSFSARLENDAAILELSLNDYENVDQIQIQKEFQGSYQTIRELEEVVQLENRFLDDDLVQGLNLYQAVVRLKNGSLVISDVTGVIFRGVADVLVYPNPVAIQSNISVLLADNGEGEFYLYSSNGKLIQKSRVVDGSEIFLRDLPSGLYYYRIIVSDGKIRTGSVLVQ
jgi:hypothetical protein